MAQEKGGSHIPLQQPAQPRGEENLWGWRREGLIQPPAHTPWPQGVFHSLNEVSMAQMLDSCLWK